MEIFQPHYGEGIARYIVSDFQNRKGSKLRICEVGAGNGTLAANVLDYVLRKHPDLYQDVKYTALEVSKPLSKRYVIWKCFCASNIPIYKATNQENESNSHSSLFISLSLCVVPS